MRLKLVTAITCLLISLPGYGSTYFPCPKSQQYIYLGYTIDQVMQACGSPKTMNSTTASNNQTVQQIQWVYNYKQWSNTPNASGRPGPYYQAHIFVVNFNSNLVVASLTVNGDEVQATNFCNPSMPITVGQSTNLQVRQLCGQASIIQTVAKKINQGTLHKAVWIYESQPYMPPTTLTFENNALVSISP